MCGYNYNSRSCVGNNAVYGSLGYLRNRSHACGVDNCSCSSNCGSCGNGCNGCLCGYNGRSNGCSRARTDYPDLVGCSGSRIFYTGCCGRAQNGCGCGCNNCESCNCCNECGACNGDCPYALSGNCGGAAEFVAVVPQSRCAGGTILFGGECDTGGMFTSNNDGIHINRDGRYLAIYSFAADACDSGATTLSLAVNGNEIYASRTHVPHGVGYASRSAVGQAVFCARAGDCLTLNTSVALNIPQTGASCPQLTMVILKIN